MEEQRNSKYTDYEPNFIMKDVIQPDQNENDNEQSGQDSDRQMRHDSRNRSSFTSEYGAYQQTDSSMHTDPRDNFRNSGFNSSFDADNFADSGYNRAGTSGSWDSANGFRPVQKHRRASRKPSPPVTLTRKSLALMTVLCVIVSGVFGFGGAALGSTLFDKDSAPAKTGSASTTGYTLEDATGSNMTVQEITEDAKASVVEIKTESVSSDSWMQQYVTEGAGSGVIITNDGYIITNNHVIEGANKITVTTIDEEEYDASIVGTDTITDVAVLKIDAGNLTPATYGNSDQLSVGDLAVAIGNPLGELGGTVTAGIISALDRQLSIDGKTMTLLQTDSSINPGNSGGGLFNGDGQLIGIVVAKSSGSDVEGLGFAIPINKAANVAQQIMDKGYVSGQPSTGMTYVEGNGQQGRSNSYDLFFGEGTGSSGVYIYSVDGINARKAGFREGDMVYAVDGTEITSFDDLSSIVTSHNVGDKLKFTVIRDGDKKDITLELEEKKAETKES